MKSGGQWDGLILYDANMFAMRKMGATYFRCCCKRTGAGIMGMNCCQILRNGWVVVLLYPSMRFHPPCQSTDVRTDWRNRHSLSASSAANIFILSVIDSLCGVFRFPYCLLLRSRHIYISQFGIFSSPESGHMLVNPWVRYARTLLVVVISEENHVMWNALHIILSVCL